MSVNEYDLTFKKFSELEAGAAIATSADKIIISDVSDDGKIVTRTLADITNLLISVATGSGAAVATDKFVLIDVSATPDDVVLRTLQDILNLLIDVAAGADPIAATDKLVVVDVSATPDALVTRTVQDIIDLLASVATGPDPAALTDKFVMIDVSATPDTVVTRTLQDIVNLVSESDPLITARMAVVTVSLVELNAGKTLIAAVTGKQIFVSDINVVCDGAFAAVTSADIKSITTSVAIFSTAVAQMGDNAILFKGATGVTLGAGFGEALPVSEGITIIKNGADATTATKLTVSITYMLITP